MAAVNLDNIQFYNHTSTILSFNQKRLASLSTPPTVTPRFNKRSSTFMPSNESEFTNNDVEEDSFPSVEQVIYRKLSKECSISEPRSKWIDPVDKGQERPIVIDDDEPNGAQDTSCPSNSNAYSVGLDAALCILPTTPSSKNDLEDDNDGFDYDAILGGDDIEGRACSADAEQRETTLNCPWDLSLYCLNDSLQGQNGQDNSANISRNGSEPSIASSNKSEKDNVGQKQLRCQVEDDMKEEREELGKEERIVNNSGDSGGSNDKYNDSDDSANQDSDEGSRLVKRRRLHRPHSEPDDASAASAMLRSTELGETQPVDRVTDAGQEWEIRSIIGRQKANGVVQYWVEWEPTWMPESELMGARYLVDEFEARLQVPPENKIEQVEADSMCETQSKKWRGRPRKNQR